MMFKLYKNMAVVMCTLTTVACTKNTTVSQDPYESYNRQVFSFNKTVDKTLLKPVAVTYDKIMPNRAQMAVGHFFINLTMPSTIINDGLQGKWHFAWLDTKHTLINTTLGVAGLFDVATRLDIPQHRNDFGTTFACWSGKEKSTFTMLPFLGPSTFRDTLTLPLEMATNPLIYLNNNTIVYSSTALNMVNSRSQLLTSDTLLYDAFDPYGAMRDAYLQKRNRRVLAGMEQGDYYPGMILTKDGPQSGITNIIQEKERAQSIQSERE